MEIEMREQWPARRSMLVRHPPVHRCSGGCDRPALPRQISPEESWGVGRIFSCAWPSEWQRTAMSCALTSRLSLKRFISGAPRSYKGYHANLQQQMGCENYFTCQYLHMSTDKGRQFILCELSW